MQIGQMSKVLQERGFGSLPSSTKTNPRDQVKSISTTIETDSRSILRIRSTQYAVSIGQNSTLLYMSRQMMVPFPSRLDKHYCKEEEGNYRPKFTEAYGASHINNAIPRKEKDPGSFTLPCFINNTCFDNALVDLGDSVSVMPLSTYLNLGLGELAHTRLIVELADRTVKYPKGIAENVLVGIGKFTFPLDFIILDMYGYQSALDPRKTIFIIRPFHGRLHELNDLNEPFKLSRNQGDDLMPTVEEGKTPQQQPPPPPAAARTVPQRLRRLEEDVQGLRRDVGSLRGLVERSIDDWSGEILHMDDDMYDAVNGC
ncbi:hypothetical protein Tco_0188769 [Tanacetum coccineum]